MEKPKWIFENSATYDFLKLLAAPILPAIATFLIAVGEIWGLPVCDLIGATVSALAVCLGAIVEKSRLEYKIYTNGTYVEPIEPVSEDENEEEEDEL